MNGHNDSKIQKKRISEIFNSEFPDHFKTVATVQFYRNYLLKNIEFPCELTGIEDFSWEEFYVLGPGSKTEYNDLKKVNPSYTDKFDLVSLDEEFDDYDGIIAKVLRKSDKKNFHIPLAELVPTDKKSNNYILLDDYSVWIVNY